MKHHYNDIREKIPSDPLWWDEVGVPRYCAFAPRETNNIYADQVALVVVACQNCGQEFKVAFAWGLMDRVMYGRPQLSELIDAGRLHYGDPPNAGCCPAGPTMNSEPRRVLEFYRRSNDRFGFERVLDYERELEANYD